jgi:hypothetical protein
MQTAHIERRGTPLNPRIELSKIAKPALRGEVHNLNPQIELSKIAKPALRGEVHHLIHELACSRESLHCCLERLALEQLIALLSASCCDWHAHAYRYLLNGVAFGHAQLIDEPVLHFLLASP